ncbi:MAG: GNAT family acetyltransferase [Desulfobacterales bacterium]|nr:GNAT family acetyltransferase [Desulfobacterales bacterium]
MEIRKFQDTDVSAVVSLWHRCKLTVAWNDPLRDVDRKKKHQPELFLVGLINSRLIASVMGGYDGHRGWIYYLAVDPDYRQRGFGSLMIEEVEARIKKTGCAKINVMVRKSNQKIADFYFKHGYGTDEVSCLGKRLVADK